MALISWHEEFICNYLCRRTESQWMPYIKPSKYINQNYYHIKICFCSCAIIMVYNRKLYYLFTSTLSQARMLFCFLLPLCCIMCGNVIATQDNTSTVGQQCNIFWVLFLNETEYSYPLYTSDPHHIPKFNTIWVAINKPTLLTASKHFSPLHSKGLK